MNTFHVTLESPESGDKNRRYFTVSKVPCPKCHNDPIARGGFELASGDEMPPCKTCKGSGDVPATKDSAVAYAEELEKEYVAFRLDDYDTVAKYPMLSMDTLDIVKQTVKQYHKDTHLVDGRFMRAGKVGFSGFQDPENGVVYSNRHKGWLQFHNQEKPYKVIRAGALSDKMVVTGGLFGPPVVHQYTGAAVTDWDSDSIKLALTTNAWTIDPDNHDRFNDVTNELSTGGNYTAGGWVLAAPSASFDTASDQARFDATDVSQASATFTARKAVVYKNTGTSSTSPLITWLDFGADVSPSAGLFSITFDTTGVFLWDVT
jgi:hypothetical protein